MAGSDLIARPLSTGTTFNWIYLTDWIVNGVLSLFFLFYFNRLFATVVLYGARLYVWRSFKVYIDIKALQISPLAGRIFFKGLRYHGDNETIFVHGGYITWRYWLRTVRECRAFQDQGINATAEDVKRDNDNSSEEGQNTGKKKPAKAKSQLPCRISVKVYGVEAFLYNRSPAYDAIVEGVAKVNSKGAPAQLQPESTLNAEKRGYGDPGVVDEHSSGSDGSPIPNRYPASFSEAESPVRVRSTPSVDSSDERFASPSSRQPLPAFLHLLPIHVECNKAAAVLGNENSKTIITAKIDGASGEFDASSSGALDVFKILIDFNAVHPYIQLKPNVDFKNTQLGEASSLKGSDETATGDEHKFDYTRVRSVFSRIIDALDLKKFSQISIWPRTSSDSIATPSRNPKKGRRGLPFIQSDVPANGRWLGLLRYLNDDENDEHNEWAPIEYARSSVLADIYEVDFKFYWDVTGPVPQRPLDYSKESNKNGDDINRGPTPDYGMELIVHGGQINYGPWADRQRIVLQQLFFPAPYADAVPTDPLRPGQARLCTVFNLTLEIKDDVILRLPFRESSKDANWKGRATALTSQGRKKDEREGKRKGRSRMSARSGKRKNATPTVDVRPFAWFDVRVGGASAVHYTMDMYPRRTGYHNSLTMDLSSVDIFSSLNHGLLWRCPQISMECDLSNPLAWNGLRPWVFDININKLDFFLLRDHTFLLVDLIEDWSSGPLPDFFTFSPYRYYLKVHFQDYKLFLNTNDANIVDNPDSLEDNEFVILYGRTLDTDLLVPLDRFRPAENAITFDVTSNDLGFQLCMPPKNTLSELVRDKDVAQLSSVTVNGSYTYCSEVKAGLTETLNMEIRGKSLKTDFYGFLARHLAKIKENYFGESVHFRTLNEYQDLARRNFAGVDSQHPVTKSNDLDVILDIIAEDINISLPSGLYDAEEHLTLHLDRADTDLRVNNYYLELMVDSSPLELSYTARTYPPGPKATFDVSETQLFIDGIKVFGHRLFGLGPSEPPYVSNWDVDAGSITGECSTQFVEKAITAAKSFALTAMDAENAVPLPHYEAIHDSTFVRFACPDIRIWCRSDGEAFLFCTKRISGSFNDFAGNLFSQQLSMTIPGLTLACIDADRLRRYRSHESRVAKTYAYFETSISLTMVQRALGFNEETRLQQQHIRIHDNSRGERASFLVREYDGTPVPRRSRDRKNGVLSLDLPCLPPPIGMSHMNQSKSRIPSPQSNAIALPRQVQVEPIISNENRTSGSLSDTVRKSYGAENHGPSAVALSSPFKIPHFPLQNVELDFPEIPKGLKTLAPPLRRASKQAYNQEPYDEEPYDDSIDEDTLHTAVIVSADQGINVYCTPEAVRTIASFAEHIQPKYPTQVLDDFHFQTITEVLTSYAKRRGKNSLVDLKIRVPRSNLTFVNYFASADAKPTEVLSDRYQGLADGLSVSVRLKNVPSRKNEANSNSMHATLSSLQILAEEAFSVSKSEQATLKMAVDDILVWLVDSDRISVHTSFRLAELVTASQIVDYLAGLIHRTTMLGDEIQARFNDIFEQREKRLQCLVFYLTTLGGQTHDPSFLTRPSYVIRSSPEHVRNSDSWKILSRLRYNYLQLTSQQRAQLSKSCITKYAELPQNAEATVLANFDSWRSWDTAQIKEAFAVRILFGSVASVEKLNDRSKIPLAVSVRAMDLRVVIDPGEKQNEFALDQLSLGLSISPPPPRSSFQLFKDHEEVQNTLVQVKTTKYKVHLNWTICGLIDGLLDRFEKSAPRSAQRSHDSRGLEKDENLREENVHIVLSSDSGLVRLETPHLIQIMTTVAPKVSVTGSGWNPAIVKTSVHGLITAHSTILETYGLGRMICFCRISFPTMWAAYEKPESNDEQETLMIGGDSKEIVLEVKEEIIGLIEVSHSFLSEEVAYFQQVADKHKASNTQTANTQIVDESSPENLSRRLCVTLTLFLNVYTLEFSLFHGIVYSTAGRTIRLAVSPDPKDRSIYQVDYDLKGQAHQLLTASNPQGAAIASMDMPPINGTLQLIFTETAIIASGLLTVEKILLHGSTLYGVLDTLSPNQLQPVFEAIKEDAFSVQKKINELFPKKEKADIARRSQRPKLLYDVGVVLAGIAISADAPSATRRSPPANILFDVQRFHLRASNQTDNEQALPLPEIRLIMHEIGIELRRVEDDSLRVAGKVGLDVRFDCRVEEQPDKKTQLNFALSIIGPTIEINADTAPLLVDVWVHFQQRMKSLDLSKEKKYLRRLTHLDMPERSIQTPESHYSDVQAAAPQNASQMRSSFSFDLKGLQIRYIVDDSLFKPLSRETEDVLLTLENINLLASNNADARLQIEGLQLALASSTQQLTQRPKNSALLPEVVFNVSHQSSNVERKLRFQAAGKALDLQLDPHFVLPISDVERSLNISTRRARQAAANLKVAPSSTGIDKKKLFGFKNLSSLTIDADFAGAVVHLQRSTSQDIRRPTMIPFRQQQGRYGQFGTDSSASNATLRAPSIALKVRYEDSTKIEPSLNIEMKVDGSKNVLYPAVVPLILQISDSVKKVIRQPQAQAESTVATEQPQQRLLDEDSIVQADPRAVLGKIKLNIGFRICKQEFALSCNPVAKVDAIAKLEDIYVTVNNVESEETGHFFAASATFRGLEASLKHVYSREATFSFDIHSIVLSIMNSKHISGTSGISAILKINPSKTQINAKQLQDVLLFREIWLPPEIRHASRPQTDSSSNEPQEYFVQRYQQVAAATAFPWNATVAIAELELDLDLGQSIGRMRLLVSNLWASSKKTTSSRQNLCVGIDAVAISSAGRMSGFVELDKVKVRTSIAWPEDDSATRTPLIQGAIGFDKLRAKAAFDYQAFAVADILSFEFLMYNVRDSQQRSGDRLVAILDGEKVSVYCIAACAAHGLSMVQAFERLVQEKKLSFEQALKDIEQFLQRRPSMFAPQITSSTKTELPGDETKDESRMPISLHTDVIVTLRSLDVGAFPSTLLDRQILRGEASDIQTRFAVTVEDERIHSGLGLTLGQLRVALANVPHPSMPKNLGDISIDEVVRNATTARGGVILRVPRVVAAMQTWQSPESNVIDYIFKSSFEGKIDVGWNYSRISFIRGMWSTHSRTLAARLGKPLPEPAVKITGAPEAPEDGASEPIEAHSATREQQKITAEVNLPQSKYTYKALEPPIIETPQLRDMGEATPPLEWVGLHRDRLPNVTHQIIIVTLLELSKEVEDAYSKILGSA